HSNVESSGVPKMGDSKRPDFPQFDHAIEGIGDRAEEAGIEVFEVVGAIKWFDASKGYGFIVPDNGLADILLHVTCLRAGGYQTAYEGARVHCEVRRRATGMQRCRADPKACRFSASSAWTRALRFIPRSCRSGPTSLSSRRATGREPW